MRPAADESPKGPAMTPWKPAAATLLLAALAAPRCRRRTRRSPGSTAGRSRSAPSTRRTPSRPYADKDAWLARARFLREQVLVSAGLWPMPEKTPAQRARLRPDRARRLLRREGLLREPPGLLRHRQPLPAGGEDGPLPGRPLPARPLGLRPPRERRRRLDPGARASRSRARATWSSRTTWSATTTRARWTTASSTRASPSGGSGRSGCTCGTASARWTSWSRSPTSTRAASPAPAPPAAAPRPSCSPRWTTAIKVSAPVNMISHYMQGGDVCENAPNLRLDTNNMEIGALMAPRPMLMVSAAGDWTRDTPRIEFPAVQSVYALLGAKDEVATVQFIADHNYNRDSREAVYALVRPVGAREGRRRARSGSAEYDRRAAARTCSSSSGGSCRRRRRRSRRSWRRSSRPARRSSRRCGPATPRASRASARSSGPACATRWPRSLPAADAILESPSTSGVEGGRAGPRHRPARPRGPGSGPALGAAAGEPGGPSLVVHPDGIEGASAREASLVEPLRRRGWLVASIDAFNTGTRPGAARHERPLLHDLQPHGRRQPRPGRPHRPRLAEAAAGRPRGVPRRPRAGRARGASSPRRSRPASTAVVADADAFATERDEAYLDRLSIPLLRSVGGFETALTLGLGARLRVHDTGGVFDTAAVEASARATGAAERLRVSREKLTDADVVAWLAAE